LNTNDRVDNLEIFINNFDRLDYNYKLIREKLPKYFRVYDWRKMNPSLFNAIEIERNVMFLILTLIIIVAAFNLVSSMVMLVNNKKKDIGILRSLGLSRNEILRIFIMSGFMIGMIGTILGFILGILFCHNINEIKALLELFTDSSIFAEEIYFFSKLPMIIDYKEVIFIIIVTLILCFCAALYPAYKASNIEPINLIKWE
jgi:lipoprotein-releasing system permease protein